MTDELQSVLAAAAAENAREPVTDLPQRRLAQLHAFAARPADPPVAPPLPIPTAPAAPNGNGEADQLGRRGLRLAFWLCGFHEALIERQNNGDTLTKREASLLDLSRRDFADMKPLVVAMAIERLHTVVTSHGAGEAAGLAEGGSTGSMEAFALETLQAFALRARTLLRDQGPDAAMSMFGARPVPAEPLAIFQAVFATAIGMIEAFEPMVPQGAPSLSRIAAALDSELDRT